MNDTLYKRDSVGKLRTWRIELNDEGHYRTHAGLADGKQAVSGWTIPKPASCPTVKEQGEFEVKSAYKHQLDREYRRTVAELDTVKAEFVEPMLAKGYDGFPGPGFAQPKLDGIRCIATAAGLFSRQGQPIVAVPHIHAALEPLFRNDPDLILDGELYNHDLREDFGAISSIVRKKNPTPEQLEKAEAVMQYHVYDMVDDQLTFLHRAAGVSLLLRDLDCEWIIAVPTVRCDTAAAADVAYGAAVEAGYEGGMFRLDAPYELGRRSKNLLKRKEFITEEFPIVAIEEGNGNWAGAAKRVTLGLADGRPFGAGIRGSLADMRQLLKERVQPGVSVATLRYFMLSPDGVPRFGVVIDIHLNGRVD